MNDEQLNWCNTVFATNLEDVLEYGIANHSVMITGNMCRTGNMTCNSAAVETHAGAITSADDERLAQSLPAGRCIICLRSTVSLFACVRTNRIDCLP